MVLFFFIISSVRYNKILNLSYHPRDPFLRLICYLFDLFSISRLGTGFGTGLSTGLGAGHGVGIGVGFGASFETFLERGFGACLGAGLGAGF